MCAVHTLVTEVLRELVNTWESANYKALEVELVCNAQIEIHIKNIVVSYKRTCVGSSRNWLKDRGFHLQITVGVEELTHGVVYCGTLLKDLSNFRIYNEIYISLAVAHLRVCKGIINLSVFLLHDR